MRFLLLGPVEFRPDARPVRLGARRERLVLGVLALHAGRAVPMARLASVVWSGEEAPDNVRQSIKVSVSRVRTVLSPYGITIIKRGDAYVLQADPADTDAGAFRAAVAAAGELGDAGARTDALREALALWRGGVLEDVAGPDAQRAIASDLIEQRLVALRRCIEIDIERGRFEDAVAELRGLVSTNPAHEPFVCLLMSALVESGRATEALDAYADLRRVLADDLGADPGPDAAQLHVKILRQQTREARPEPRSPVQTLPRDVPMFTGRTDEFAALDGHLAGAAPLVVITGSGGVGKTALAVHWAHHATARFPDGQLFVNLRGYGTGQSPSSVDALTQLLLALGEPLTAIPPSVDGATSLFRARMAGQRMLVVVDNAASADQVRPLLPGSSSCGVVVTSRDPLNGLTAVDGAERISLRQLSDRQSLAVLASVLGEDRIRHETDAAGRLAAACGGLPLALRVAAANLAGRPEQSIAAFHDEMIGGSVLDALQVDGDLTMGVRATFANSYDALSIPARRLFRLLGVPAGADFPVDVCAALAGDPLPVAQTLVDELCRAHLVDPQDGGRFGMHDLVRAYAVEVGAAAETGPARDRLLGYYLHTANYAAGAAHAKRRYLSDEEVPPDLPVHVFDDRLSALAWLDLEVASLVAEAMQAADRGPYAFAWKICDTLAGYFWVRRHAALWIESIEAAERATVAAGDERMALLVRNRRGIMHWAYGEYDHAERTFLDVVATGRRLGDLGRVAGGFSNLSGIARDLERLRDAKAWAEACLATHVEMGGASDFDIGGVLINLAFLGIDLEEYAEALGYARRAVAGYRDVNHQDGIAAGLVLVAYAQVDLGEPDEARAALDEAWQTFSSIGASSGLCAASNAYSYLDRVVGRIAEAVAWARQAIAYGEESQQLGQLAGAHSVLASALIAAGDAAGARREYVIAERLARDVGIKGTVADALLGLARIAIIDGDPDGARRYATEAMSMSERPGSIVEGREILDRIAAG